MTIASKSPRVFLYRLTGFAFALLAGLHALAQPAVTQAPVTPPALEHFFGNNAFGDAALSPGGTHLAVRTGAKGKRDFLAVIDLETAAVTVVALSADSDIGQFQWVNDHRLVYNVHDSTEGSADQQFGPGLWAVKRDGTDTVQLANRASYGPTAQSWNITLLAQLGKQDTDWIYVQRPVYDKWKTYVTTQLLRLNTVTGAVEHAPQPNVPVNQFWFDFKGEPRLARSTNAITNTLYYRDPATHVWRSLASFATYQNARDKIMPLGFGPTGTLYVAAYGGENTSSLRTMDLATGKVSADALVVTPGYDFDGALVSNDAKVLGVRVTTDAEANAWFDPAMKEIQKDVDKALPNTVNLIVPAARAGAPRVLVQYYSDRQPARFGLYHTKTGVVKAVGNSYPQIQPAHMAEQETIRFTARDGLGMQGLLTLPPGGARQHLPMVMLVHGGPWVRGSSWGWNAETQFLASRGYAVLEVEFRGSTGFGIAHYEAGIKQWGLAMQNDIADGARWAIAQGIADPRRVCIAGSSYGGYATLMGLVNDPDLYRCGVEWLGVTDIELMYTGTWLSSSNMSDGYLNYGMPVLIGDRVKDAAQLKATSPIQQAARIGQPLLLAYGLEDRRVPIYHGKRFYSAVKRHNKQVEWVEYSGEGHGWSLPANRIDFWQRVEKFLGKHIGPGTAAAADAAH